MQCPRIKAVKQQPLFQTNIVSILWLVFTDHFHQPHFIWTDRNLNGGYPKIKQSRTHTHPCSEHIFRKNMACMPIESNRIKPNWLSIEACISAKLQVFRLAYNPIKVESFVVFVSVYISVRSILLQQFHSNSLYIKAMQYFFVTDFTVKRRFCYNSF